MLGHRHGCDLVLFVDVDLLHLGRAKGLGDELSGLFAVLDDVDLLASQFVDDLANP